MGSLSGTAMQISALEPEFSSLYREYFGFAWASLRRLGVSPATIDDAAQDLWVTVHRRLESLDPAASVKAWLFGIARRVASHYRRTEQRHQRKLAAYSVTDVRRTAEPMKRGEAAMTMEAFLAQLDETKRVAFVLSEVEGWSAPEIARVVGTSPNTIYSRVRLAREQLRKHLHDSDSAFSPAVCVEAMRATTEPPPEAEKRCWIALAPKLATSATVATAAGGTLAKLKLIGLGALLGGFGVVGLDAALPQTPTPETAPVVAAAPIVAAEPEDPPALPTTPSVAPEVRPEAPAPPLQKPSPAAAPAAQPTAQVDGLEQETKLLTEAKRQLAAGDPIAALGTLSAHAKAHPDSKLADVRHVLEVQATCDRGQHQQAKALAEHYAAKASEAAANKLRAACDE